MPKAKTHPAQLQFARQERRAREAFAVAVHSYVQAEEAFSKAKTAMDKITAAARVAVARKQAAKQRQGYLLAHKRQSYIVARTLACGCLRESGKEST